MDELRFDKEEETIYITELYSEKPLITIYENMMQTITFELRDGEYTAALSKAQVDELIQHLQEIVKHEDSKE